MPHQLFTQTSSRHCYYLSIPPLFYTERKAHLQHNKLALHRLYKTVHCLKLRINFLRCFHLKVILDKDTRKGMMKLEVMYHLKKCNPSFSVQMLVFNSEVKILQSFILLEQCFSKLQTLLFFTSEIYISGFHQMVVLRSW